MFGSITALMAVLLLLAMLVWTGVLPFPFDRNFTAAPDPNKVVTPCLPADAEPVDLATISANVYNSTSRSGIAAEAASQLSGVSVVASRYGRGDSAGVVAVIGPTRMDYSKVLRAVRIAGTALGDL